jgi:uncharacterized delta-60 repeat protein
MKQKVNVMILSSMLRWLLSPFEQRSLPRKTQWRSLAPVEVCEGRLLLAAADLDVSFDGDGKVFLEAADNRDDEVARILIRPDGKIITVGSVDRGNSDYDFVVHQRLSNGAPDLSFGTGGYRYIAFDNGGNDADFAYGAALQPDGKLIVVGSTEVAAGGRSVAVARLTVSGSLDTEFGSANNGKRVFSINSQGPLDFGRDVLIEPDSGRVIIVGDSRTVAATQRLFLAILDPNGSIVEPGVYFPTGTTGNDRAYDAALQPDGKIVVTGYSSGTATEAWVVRLQPDSTSFKLDTSFSGDGRMQLRNSFFSDIGADAKAITLQSDGKIVIAGTAMRSSGTDPRDNMLVARINSDGTLDSTFGTRGSRQIAFDSSVTGSGTVRNWATAVFVQPDGKIVAGGMFRKRDGNEDFAVVRLMPNGDNDVLFYPVLGTGRRHYAIDVVSGSGGDDEITAMALATDGKIYLAGNAAGTTGDQSVIMRLSGDPNFAPTNIQLSRSTIDENLPAPAIVGTFSSEDASETGIHTYKLVPGPGATDNASFSISGNTLATSSVFDFESKSVYSIRVRSTDPYGLFYERTFEIRVLNILDGAVGSDEFTVTYTASSVSISLSINGGAAIDQGTFALSDPIVFENLTSADTVRVLGTGGHDTFDRTGIIVVNGRGSVAPGAAKVILAGGAGNDTYRFPVDALAVNPLLTTLDEAGGGIDTLDFSGQSLAVRLNLNYGLMQAVNSKISLNLQSHSTFENVIGTSFNDSLTGNALGNTLHGGPGDDTLNGALGSDLLFGGANNDIYLFGASSAAEADQVTENVNEGIDTLNFAYLTTNVVLNMAANSVQPVHTNRTLKLNSPITFENAIGGSGADTLIGNSLNNTLVGGPGNDTLNGASGNDLLFGGADNDTYLFGAATVAEADQVTENLNEGSDTLNFATVTTGIRVNLAENAVQPVHANRTLKLNSPITFDNVVGGSGADTLIGNTLNNILTGGPGNDQLNGAAGSDRLFGGANHDTYLFGSATAAEADHVTENANEGIDLLNFAFLATDVVLNLGSAVVQAVHTNRTLTLNSASTIENAVGGTGNDTLLGNALANRLTGGEGNNILVGFEAGDILVAGSGRDILIGGPGLDVLNGGAGEDILIAGRTTSDTSLTSLATLRTGWISAAPYATRVSNLRAGVGNPVSSLKAKLNVLNDAGEDDSLSGGGNTDWYFRALDDVITDLVAGELIDVL